MDKINVLWIEDNPIQESVFVEDLLKRDPALKSIFPNELYGNRIPAIHFTEEYAGCEKYFNLQVLQHPLENKDFITMCLRLEDRFGFDGFKKLSGVVPEVIAFDYHFGENITVNRGAGAMDYFPSTKPLRQFINPNYRFVENQEVMSAIGEPNFILERPESENYTKEEFLMAISRVESYSDVQDKDEQDLITDDFGLLTAVEILRLFRGHTVVAMPTTFVKNQVENLSLHGKYFEWLNEHDYSVDFNRSNRGEKKWDLTLKDAMIALQKKLLNHLRLGKISVAFSHLNDLTKRPIPEQRIFQFESVYGRRQLPLDGLFFYVPKAQRDHAINEWAVSLSDMYAKQNGVSYSDYKEAANQSEDLINAYATDLVDKRIELSKRVVQLLNKEIPQTDERLKELMDFFGVAERHIRAFEEGKSAQHHQIGRHAVDFRSVSHDIGRLVVLMTQLRLHVTYQQFRESEAVSTMDTRMAERLKPHPNDDDLLFALFPVARSPLVLPFHLIFLNNVFEETTMKAKLKQPYEGWWTALDNLELREKGEFPANLTDGERRICRSFADEIKLKSKFYPSWLEK